MFRYFVILCLAGSFLHPGKAQDVDLEILMPANIYGPGSPFYMYLKIDNTGPALAGSQVFVALRLSARDFWLYPGWVRYPPNTDWGDADIEGYSQEFFCIVPYFTWPEGAGSFSNALFLGAIVHNDTLVSNVAETSFGWSKTPQPTPTQTNTPFPNPGSLYSTDPIIGNMRAVPAGTFFQGADIFDEPCCFSGEIIFAHTLTQNIGVMETLVTRGMWAALKAVKPDLPKDPSDFPLLPTMDHPIQQVSWFEVLLFANLLSIQNGLTPAYYIDESFTVLLDSTNYTDGPFFCAFHTNGYRLPTEGEWEYFTRAGTSGPYWADEPNYNWDTCEDCNPSPSLNVLDSIAWWCGNSGWPDSIMPPVGAKLPNPWGLFDVHGLLQQWCWDWYKSYPIKPVTDFTGPESGVYRVFRGGRWSSHSRSLRSAARNALLPGERWQKPAFRLVRTDNGISFTPTSTPSETPTPSAATSTPTQIPTPTPTPTPVSIDYIYIPPGNFTQGSSPEEACRMSSEDPLHTVVLTRGFSIMTTEVTRQVWADLKAGQQSLPDDPSSPFYSPGMDHPVNYISWCEAVLFSNLLSVQNGLVPCYYKDPEFTVQVDATNYWFDDFFCNFDSIGFRLPTEAEWEYAARAGTSGAFSIDEPNYNSENCYSCSEGLMEAFDSVAWWCGNAYVNHPVSTKLPNPWGLFDMHGNVIEWCWDRYDVYTTGIVTDPVGPDNGTLRVQRGGSFGALAKQCRSANREGRVMIERSIHYGFRLVRTASITD